MLPFLVICAELTLSCWVVVSTVRRLCRIRAGWRWWCAFAVLAGSGLAAGSWLALNVEYHVSPTTRFCSFPMPLAFLRLENGQWVDYVTPPEVMYSGLFANVVGIMAAALLSLFLFSFLTVSKEGDDR